MTWRVYYDDGSTYGPEDGPVEDAPGWGVQVVMQLNTNGDPGMVADNSVYWWGEGRWWGADEIGMYDQLALPGWKKMVFGRTVRDEAHWSIRNRALREWGLIVE